MRVHQINNLNKALNVLQECGVKLVNISSDDINSGNAKLTLGLIWLIALTFDGQKLVNSQAKSGIEKSLLVWARQLADKYGIKVCWYEDVSKAYNFQLNGILFCRLMIFPPVGPMGRPFWLYFRR